GAEPVGEVDEDAGEETGLGDAQQDSNEVEMRGRSNERHQDGDEPPGDHDAREPFARAPALDNEAAGNFEEQVADKKYSRAEAEDAVAEVQVVRHFERGVADVYAVEKGDDEKGEEKRQEAPRNAAARAYTDGGSRNGDSHPAWASNIMRRGLHANEKTWSWIGFRLPRQSLIDAIELGGFGWWRSGCRGRLPGQPCGDGMYREEFPTASCH